MEQKGTGHPTTLRKGALPQRLVGAAGVAVAVLAGGGCWGGRAGSVVIAVVDCDDGENRRRGVADCYGLRKRIFFPLHFPIFSKRILLSVDNNLFEGKIMKLIFFYSNHIGRMIVEFEPLTYWFLFDGGDRRSTVGRAALVALALPSARNSPE